jgi:hypothetical protein
VGEYTVKSIFISSKCGKRATNQFRTLHYEELNDLYSSPSIIRIIKSRMMKWAAIAPIREKRNVYRLLVGKPEGKRPLGRPRHRRWITLRWI